MIYDQRAPETPPEPGQQPEGRPWQPDETPVAGPGWEVRDGDRYVAIDRIDGPVATLAIAPWPSVDPATGRLDFGPRRDRRTDAVPVEVLQARVDRDRAQHGQLIRPLRPSDVFLVRGIAADPAGWELVIDVTRSGRLAAKASLYSTAAPAPTAEALADYGLERELADDRGPAATPTGADETEPPPPGPVAYPAV